MSWSITINDLDQIEKLPAEKYAVLAKDNPAYESDARAAFKLAKRIGLVSATISGGRTPSMYGGPDSVAVSIVGFDSRREGHAVPPAIGHNFNDAVLANIYGGPDPESEFNDSDDYVEDDEPYPAMWHAPYEGEQ